MFIQRDDANEDSITFGYGIFGLARGGLCSHTSHLRDIDTTSIITGYASGRDNLFQFGGWGIKRSIWGRTWSYNASFRGPYVEFIERHEERFTKYRIATQSPELIVSILRDINDENTKKLSSQ